VLRRFESLFSSTVLGHLCLWIAVVAGACSQPSPNESSGQAGGAGTGSEPRGGADAGIAGAPAGATGGTALGGGGSGNQVGGTSSSGSGGGSALAGTGGSSSGGSFAGGAAGSAGGGGVANGGSGGSGPAWVGTWSAAAQRVETANEPPAPGLANHTLRQIFYVSIGGKRLRVHLSNAYGASAVTMTSVHLALSDTGSAITAGSDHALLFEGKPSVTIAPGAVVTSDPLDFSVPMLAKVALSIAFGAAPAEVTGHPGSRTTSYIVNGDAAGSATLNAPVTTDHWYYATGIDVASDAPGGAIVTLGDSITDGRGSTTNGNDRWPDDLSRRLRQNAATSTIGLLNQGLGGNAVLSVSNGNGPPANTRFQRDVLEPAGVRWLIVLHGVNDIGVATSQNVAQDLIKAYGDFITLAHAKNIRAYGVPILPFGASMYDSTDHEAARQTVNTWIRAPGHYDAVIDLDATVRDPANQARLSTAYDSGDHLHLNAAGYQKMADAIDLSLFTAP